jgi:hypothetical protein
MLTVSMLTWLGVFIGVFLAIPKDKHVPVAIYFLIL